MKNVLHIFNLLFAILIAACTTTKAPAPIVKSPVTVKLIGFNDFHGNLKTPTTRIPVIDPTQPSGIRFDVAGGVEQFAVVVKQLKEKNPNHVVVSAGDMVGATPLISALFKDEPTIEAMNLIGVDFHAVGNHEFDNGVKNLKRLQNGGCFNNDCQGKNASEAFKGADFAFLAANVIENETGKTLFPPYAIKAFNGEKIAFIGVGLGSTPEVVRASGVAGATFRDEVETVNALIPQIRAQGVEAIVVLVHEGGSQTGGINDCKNLTGPIVAIAEKLDPAVDIIISGHTHQFYNCNIAGKLLTSAGKYGALVTEIDLTIDPITHDIINKQAKNIAIDPNGNKDAALTALVEKYAKLSEPLENRIVGKATKEIPYITDTTIEFQLNNLIADAQLYATAAPDKGGAVIAFNNPDSVRAPLIPNTKGEVTYGALFKVQPFGNDLITMTLTGKQIKILLEQQFTYTPRKLLAVSKGFSYNWDNNRTAGNKVLAETIKLNGMTVLPDLQYRVTANSFSAGGAEGLKVFTEGTDRQIGMLDLDALVAYLSAQSPYSAPGLGRITRQN